MTTDANPTPTLTAHRYAGRVIAYDVGPYHFAVETADLIERDSTGQITRSAYLQPADAFQLTDELNDAARGCTHGVTLAIEAQYLFDSMLTRYVGPRGWTHAEGGSQPVDSN